MSRIIFDLIPESLLHQATKLFIDQFGEIFDSLSLSPNDLYLVVYEMLSDKKVLFYEQTEELISFLIPTFGDQIFNINTLDFPFYFSYRDRIIIEDFFKSTFSIKDTHNTHIRYFLTKDGYKSQGIGSEIVNYLEELAISKGKSNITLSVIKNNVRAVEFYKKHGYIINGEFYCNNEFYTMIKYI